MGGFKLKRQGSGKQCSRSEIGRGGRERGRVRTNKSQRKNRHGEVKEHGNADGLWCVYLNTRNIVGNVDEFRAWTDAWVYNVWLLQKHGGKGGT